MSLFKISLVWLGLHFLSGIPSASAAFVYFKISDGRYFHIDEAMLRPHLVQEGVLTAYLSPLVAPSAVGMSYETAFDLGENAFYFEDYVIPFLTSGHTEIEDPRAFVRVLTLAQRLGLGTLVEYLNRPTGFLNYKRLKKIRKHLYSIYEDFGIPAPSIQSTLKDQISRYTRHLLFLSLLRDREDLLIRILRLRTFGLNDSVGINPETHDRTVSQEGGSHELQALLNPDREVLTGQDISLLEIAIHYKRKGIILYLISEGADLSHLYSLGEAPHRLTIMDAVQLKFLDDPDFLKHLSFFSNYRTKGSRSSDKME